MIHYWDVREGDLIVSNIDDFKGNVTSVSDYYATVSVLGDGNEFRQICPEQFIDYYNASDY